jgi:integrase
MGELRERMQHDLVVRGMSPRTPEAYLAAVAGLAKPYRQRPDGLRDQQVEAYIRPLLEQRHLAPNSVRSAVFGLRFFYLVTLKRPALTLPLPKGAKKLPEVWSRAEVTRLLAQTATLRERAVLMTTYGGGLRVSEVVRLRVSAIDAQRDLLRVEQGKGRKDRYTLLGATPAGRVAALPGRCIALRRRGCSPSVARPRRWRSRPRRGSTTRPSAGRASRRVAAFTPYAMPLPLIGWQRARLCPRCNAFWALTAARRLCATSMSPRSAPSRTARRLTA